MRRDPPLRLGLGWDSAGLANVVCKDFAVTREIRGRVLAQRHLSLRTVSLPARLQKSVTVGQRTVGLRLTAESLRVETATLWSSVSVQVQIDTKPCACPWEPPTHSASGRSTDEVPSRGRSPLQTGTS